MSFHTNDYRNDGRVPNRLDAPVANRWSTNVPAIAVGVAIMAWVLILGSLLFSGLERNRIAAALGLLLPISALAPFSMMFRKKKPSASPAPIEPKTERAQLPSQQVRLVNAPAESIPCVLPLWRLFDRIARTGRTDYPVVDESGHLIGIISHDDLPVHSARDVLGWLVAADVMRPPRSAA
jgi:CBS domain-containing protein